MRRSYRRRPVVRVVLTSSCVTASMFVVAEPAQAAPCPDSNHCYAIVQATNISPGVQGAYIDQHRNWMTAGEGSPYGNFINSEVWILPPAQDRWVEGGLTSGGVNGGGLAYQTFYADLTPGLSPIYQEFTIAQFAPDGGTEALQISQGVTPNFWRFYRNGSWVFTSRNSGFWTNTRIDVGAELLSTDSDARADSFEMNARTFDSNNNVLYMPANSMTNTWPCPANVGCFDSVWGSPTISQFRWRKLIG